MQTYIEKTALSDEMQTLKDKASAFCKKYRALAENDLWQKAIQAYSSVCDAIKAIEALPTVDIDAITESHEKIGYDKGFREGYAQATVDAVKVVRCKDCTRYVPFKDVDGVCLAHNKGVLIIMSQNGYCNLGERREDDETG